MADGKWQMADGKPSLSHFQFAISHSPARIPGKEVRMAKYQHFEELPVWQEAAKLYNAVLDLFEQSSVPLSPGFRNQLDRAALSVSNNIAEGFERSTTN